MYKPSKHQHILTLLIKTYAHMRKFLFLITLAMFSSMTKSKELEVATFAGGCFWCMEEAFENLDGVEEVISGFQGGVTANPTYNEVSSGKTNHFESVQVIFNPRIISYEQLLNIFWKNIDPTDGKGQFCDEGSQYRSGIFYHNDKQKRLIEKSILLLQSEKPFEESIKTIIRPVVTFYKAENKLQDYYKKHPWIYKFYKYTCGRNERLKEVWNMQ